MSGLIKKLLLLALGLGLLAALALAFVPEPVAVDVAEIARGPMLVSVDEDGKTRIRERYIVSAPLAGRLERLALDPGDRVEADGTVVAAIDPTSPALLDARARAEAGARVRGAEAAVNQSEAVLGQARSTLDFTEDDLAKARRAREGGAVFSIELASKEMLQRRTSEAYRAAEFGLEIARFELEQAEAALLATTDAASGDAEGEAGERFLIRAPITGRVLRVFQESMAVVAPGAPILELGDPADLEIVVDVLSNDAVRIEPGDRVIVEHWGGDEPLEGRVRRIEPSAFTKVSALGVEEQRVNVIVDLVSPPAERPTLGDAFRVEVAIVLWSDDDVVQAPLSALFRAPGATGATWSTYVVTDGRAVVRTVEVGHENGLVAEVRSGLETGEVVVAHPGNHVRDGVRVARRSG